MSRGQDGSIGLFKSIWKQDSAGVWSVHGMKGIDLKPKKGFDANYFKIDSKIELLTETPGPIFQDVFATFGDTEFLVRQSVVPIVAWNKGDTEVRCIGTGFFISASGYLLSAGHVLRDPFDEGYATATAVGERTYRVGDNLHVGILLPTNPAMRDAPFAVPDQLRNATTLVCPIEWVQYWGTTIESPLIHEKPQFRFDIDIAICKVAPNLTGGAYQPLNIGPHALNVGDRAVAIGYAEMQNIPMTSKGQVQPELRVSVGKVTNIYADNLTEKRTPTPGPCFEFDARIPGKMSGSPILVGSGILTKGVVSRSWQGENLASGCLIAPVMGLKLQHVGEKSLAELMTTGNEGIAVFRSGGL